MSSTVKDEFQINRTLLYIILALALGLVAAVLFGARYTFNTVAQQPVAMPELPSPKADSAECAALIDALPAKVAGHRRAKLAQPAPAGAAAWQSSSTERVTLRCGVDLPLQYTTLAVTEKAGGTEWLRVDDPASELSTWFTVNRSPVVAVTAERSGRAPVGDIDASALPLAENAPAPAPLSQLAAGDASACGSLEAAAPQEIAEGFSLIDAPQPHTLAWQSSGNQTVVVRCGVADPANYAPGAQLVQVNGVPWFEDDADAASSTYYALGREAVVAASIPLTGSNEIITNLSDLIAGAIPARAQS